MSLLHSCGWFQWILPLDKQFVQFVPLTAFLIPFCIHIWIVLPFGLCNAPPHYSRLVVRTYGGLERMQTFVDDGGIDQTKEDNIVQDLRAFLDKSGKFKLKLKPNKVHIGYEQLEFVGHKLSKDRLSILDGRIEKV